MRTKELRISIEKYKKVWEKMQGSMQFKSPGIDPMMKSMTVMGMSGKGTPFENEYDRMMDEHLNPPMPPFIEYINLWGRVIIRPDRNK